MILQMAYDLRSHQAKQETEELSDICYGVLGIYGHYASRNTVRSAVTNRCE